METDQPRTTQLAGGLETWTDEKERLYGNPPHPPQSTPTRLVGPGRERPPYGPGDPATTRISFVSWDGEHVWYRCDDGLWREVVNGD